jgi:hypothetical protein
MKRQTNALDDALPYLGHVGLRFPFTDYAGTLQFLKKNLLLFDELLFLNLDAVWANLSFYGSLHGNWSKEELDSLSTTLDWLRSEGAISESEHKILRDTEEFVYYQELEVELELLVTGLKRNIEDLLDKIEVTISSHEQTYERVRENVIEHIAAIRQLFQSTSPKTYDKTASENTKDFITQVEVHFESLQEELESFQEFQQELALDKIAIEGCLLECKNIEQQLDAMCDEVETEFTYRAETCRAQGKLKHGVAFSFFEHAVTSIQDGICRIFASSVRDVCGFPVLPIILNRNLPTSVQGTPATLIRVILERLPVPTETVSFEDILEFQRDNTNRERIRRLRRWIRQFGSTPRNELEAKQEIEDLLADYKRGMRLNKIEYRSGVVESLVVGTAEVLENLAKLRFGALAKQLFSVGTQKVKLLKAEASTKGGELAYIYHAARRFRKER